MKTRKTINKNWKFPKKLFRVFLVFIMILYLQLCYLTLSPVIYGKNMKEFAANRNTVKTVLTANRGTIFDRDGKTLALNVSTYTVIAYLSESRTTDENNPQHVVDKKMTAEKLAPILGMEASAIEALLNREAYQVELGPGGRGITELVKDEIVALELPGIDFIETVNRNYPNGDFASYIIGYAKQYEETVTDENTGSTRIQYNIVGELGIESKYDDLLRGIDGYLEYQRDRYGYKIPDTKEIRIDPEDGADIYLTLDSSIQRFVETAVKEASATYTPEWLMLHVMDAKTGEILASGSTPSFDPNIKNITNYENPLVSYVFEPGSTMKIYTYMCAMEKGTYDGDATFASGSFAIGPDYINDWDNNGWGTISYDTGFLYSSNVGIANLLQNYISKSDLRDCLEKYGFGAKTGIELSREFTGSIEFNYPIEVAAAGYGQGITTTAVQHLQALSMIANNGKMVTPRIIDKIVDPNTGEILYEGTTKVSEQLVKESTINKIKDLMYQVVNSDDPNATGRPFKVEGFDVIAKTGTAQIYENGGYLTGKYDYIYSFAGMFPKDDPEIIIYAAVKKPSTGGKFAITNAVKSVIESIAKYRNMFNDNDEADDTKEMTLPSCQNEDVETVKAALEEFGATVTVIGNGSKIVNQYPYKGKSIVVGDRVFLVTNGPDKVMPDILGWSRADIETLANLSGISVTFDGYGYGTSQSIVSGTAITENMELVVTLKEKFDLGTEVIDESDN